jgi:hypothetical protein
MPTSSLSYSSLRVLMIWYSGSDKLESWEASRISGSHDDKASNILFSVNSGAMTKTPHKTNPSKITEFICSYIKNCNCAVVLVQHTTEKHYCSHMTNEMVNTPFLQCGHIQSTIHYPWWQHDDKDDSWRLNLYCLCVAPYIHDAAGHASQ